MRFFKSRKEKDFLKKVSDKLRDSAVNIVEQYHFERSAEKEQTEREIDGYNTAIGKCDGTITEYMEKIKNEKNKKSALKVEKTTAEKKLNEIEEGLSIAGKYLTKIKEDGDILKILK